MIFFFVLEGGQEANQKNSQEDQVFESAEEEEDEDYGYTSEQDIEDEEGDREDNISVNETTPVYKTPTFGVDNSKFKQKEKPSIFSSSKEPSKMPRNQDSRNSIIMTHDVVNIPGNPTRVLLRIIQRDDGRRYLLVLICANAGPMSDVINNYKLEVHEDGSGCLIELPLSPSFFSVENANMIGYKYEKNGDICGPIEHVNALRCKFENEDAMFHVVEKLSVSFSALRVHKRVLGPKVMTKHVLCPTFMVYLEIIKENTMMKQKVTLDDDEPCPYGKFDITCYSFFYLICANISHDSLSKHKICSCQSSKYHNNRGTAGTSANKWNTGS